MPATIDLWRASAAAAGDTTRSRENKLYDNGPWPATDHAARAASVPAMPNAAAEGFAIATVHFTS
jgi:hypothetical protein